MVPSLLAAFLGGLLVLGGHAYFVLTGQLLIAAGALMVLIQTAASVDARPFGSARQPPWGLERGSLFRLPPAWAEACFWLPC